MRLAEKVFLNKMLSRISETKKHEVAGAWRKKKLHIEKFPVSYSSSSNVTTVVKCIGYISVKRLLFIHAALIYKTFK
jgi:hypothetical protein